ncbi:RDD family protein [Microbacterium sp. RG1]|uniref:RDD family protein n=1 Tax=Microbacterium sp. RG1 TaxID=2489212 RepID=UPI00137567D3|nr:RDD family protein [Microbacterium sp. RG1]
MSLPPQFTGEPAGVGARLAAFTIDVAIVVTIGVTVALVSGSAVFGLLVSAEAVLALWILQARTGSGPGKALFGLRVARLDGPYSPGAGRSFVRGLLVGIGSLVFGAGAWVVEGSASADRSGLRRSWADRAAQTVVVAAPRRPAAERRSRRRSADEIVAVPSPTVIARPWSPAPVESGKARGPIAAPVSPEPPAAPVTAAAAAPDVPAPAAAVAGWAGPTAAAPIVDQADPGERPTGELLLIFDTGQRARLPLPVAVNLGRSPEQTEQTDLLVTVTDPDSSVSKTHLRLEFDHAGLWVTDTGSTNGTELLDDDGQVVPLAPHARTFVDDDTRIRIGNRIFTVSRLIGAAS